MEDFEMPTGLKIVFALVVLAIFVIFFFICSGKVEAAVPAKWEIVDVLVNKDMRGNPLGGYEVRVEYKNGNISYSDRIILVSADVELLKKHYHVKNNKQLRRQSFFATSTSTWKNDLMTLIGRQPVG